MPLSIKAHKNISVPIQQQCRIIFFCAPRLLFPVPFEIAALSFAGYGYALTGSQARSLGKAEQFSAAHGKQHAAGNVRVCAVVLNGDDLIRPIHGLDAKLQSCLFPRRLAEVIQTNFLYDTQSEPVLTRWRDQIELVMPRHIAKFKTFPSVSEWKQNVRATMNYTRRRPRMVINWVCQRLHLTRDEREAYFRTTLDLLTLHNEK